MQFEEVIKTRSSTKMFGDKQVSKEDLDSILEAGRLAPTAKNLQPQKIYVLTTKEYLDKVDKVTPCRYNAPTCLLVCADKDIAWKNGDYSSYEMDATIVATHMMLKATDLGVGSVWVRYFDADTVSKEFDLPESIAPICFLQLGYADENYAGNPLHNIRKNLSETVIYK